MGPIRRSGTRRDGSSRLTRTACTSVLAALVCLLGPPSPAVALQAQKNVLVLYSTGRDAQISIVGERELPQILDRALSHALDYYSEYIDAGRFPDEQYQKAFGDFLRQKYSGLRFDVIIAMQDVAIQFLTTYRRDLFPDTPIVFFAATPPPQSIANATGLVAEVEFSGSVSLALALQPDLRQVFVVSGKSDRDRAWEAGARAKFRRFEPRLAFTYLSGLRTPDLEAQLAALPPHAIVYYLLVYQDGAGNNFQPLDYLDRVAAVANRPIYSWIDSTIGHGVVGGSMQRLQSQIVAVATLAVRVLWGEPAGRIPISSPDLHVPQVDWRQLRRWRIDEARVPAGTEVLYRTPGVWDRYKLYIVGAVAILLAQSALIAGLLVQANRRRRAEERLSRSDRELRTSYERIRDLGARLIDAQDQERAHIARELHDDVSQKAALLAMHLHLLLADERDAAGGVQQHAREALDDAKGIVRSVRHMSHRLHPAKLRLIGLVPSLQGLQREFSSSGLSVTFDHHGVHGLLPHDLSLCLFRIAQEALVNAAKHSGARTVSVTLAGGPATLSLIIADDGVGFDVDAVAGKGLGLVSIAERLDPVGGTLHIVSAPGAGTRLEVVVPFDAAALAQSAGVGV